MTSRGSPSRMYDSCILFHVHTIATTTNCHPSMPYPSRSIQSEGERTNFMQPQGAQHTSQSHHLSNPPNASQAHAAHAHTQPPSVAAAPAFHRHPPPPLLPLPPPLL